MPRAKADHVQIVRIEFNQRERELLETATAVYGIEKTAEAINDLLSFKNLYIGATVLEMITGQEILLGTPNDLAEVLEGLKTWFRSGGGAFFDPNSPPMDFGDPESMGRRAVSFAQYMAIYGPLASIAWLLRWPVPEDYVWPDENGAAAENGSGGSGGGGGGGGGFDTIGADEVGGPFGSPI